MTPRGASHVRTHSHPLLPAETFPPAGGEPGGAADDPPRESEAAEPEREALIGAELTTDRAVERNPTVAALGGAPAPLAAGPPPPPQDAKGGCGAEPRQQPQQQPQRGEVEHRKVVATEVVPDPVQWSAPEPILQNAIVLLDPALAECAQLVESAKRRGLFVTAVVPEPNNDTSAGKNAEYHPTAEALLETGVHQVYEPPVGSAFDVVECANHLQTLEAQRNLRYLGVVPLRESAVDVCDVLAALLGLAIHNDLGSASARRDKGLMKRAVADAGLRVARFARLTDPDGADVPGAIESLGLDFPVVVKTPRGMGGVDVHICETMEEAIRLSGEIVRSFGPDGKKALFSLLEEFIGGDEFAVSVVASPTTPRGVQVTDVWKCGKVPRDGAFVDMWQDMVDPHHPQHAALVRYGEGVARAVGIKHGMARVEMKAALDPALGRYVDPVMIEVGACIAGGRRAIAAQAAVPGWRPFDALVDTHCGFPVRVPPSFRPVRHARRVFVPSDGAGTVGSMGGGDFDRLGTHHTHVMTVDVGRRVRKATDITGFAGHVWLIGSEEEVERDTEIARREFRLEVG